MTSQEAYKRLLIKVNKIDSNEGITILLSTFVLLFNSEVLGWLREKIKDDSDNVDLNAIEELLEVDVPVVKIGKVDDSFEFQLPDYFKYVSSYSLIPTKEKCPEAKYFHHEKKSLSRNITVEDEFTGPQLDFEEGPVLLTKKKLKVFVKDFEIGNTFVTYYRTPKKIDIEGYIHFDETPSVDIDPDLSDENVEEILNRIATEIKRGEKDIEGFQLAKEKEV